MQNTRRMRLQAVIQDELSQIVPRELKDPRIPPLTFTAVEVTTDASQATVFVALLGGSVVGIEGAPAPTEQELNRKMKECLQGLASASGFLRRHLARVLNIRHVPTLVFKEDRGFENAIRVQELLKQITEAS
jgi:ribosome-binding factor A